MGFLASLFGVSPEKVKKTCLSVYAIAKRKRPGKPDRDCLKIVLLTKPPFDYQLDVVIEKTLDEFSDIDTLSEFISKSGRNQSLWESRRRNLKDGKIKERNKTFFVEFWG